MENNTQPISSVAPPTEQPPINSLITDATTSTPLPQPQAEQRAWKFNFGMPDFETYDKIAKGIMSGQEGMLRDAAANYKQYRLEQAKAEAVYNYATMLGRAPTPEDTDFVNKVLELNTSTDPKSVVEKYYSENFFNRLRGVGMLGDGDWDKQSPGNEQNVGVVANDLQTFNEVIRTWIENHREMHKNTSYGRSVWDTVKETLIPGYWQMMQRGGPVSQLEGGLDLPANKEAQYQAYLAMPMAERIQRFNSDANALYDKDPGLALDWAESLLGQSHDQKAMDKIMAGLDFIGQPIGAKTLFKGGRVIAERIANREFRTAVTTAINDIGKQKIINGAAVDEAVGDLGGAAVKEANNKVIADIRGKTNTDRELERSTSSMTGTIDKLKTERPLRTDFVNRIVDRYEAIKESFLKLLTDSVKVDQLSGIFASEANIKLIAEDVKKWPGMENNVLDIGFKPDALGTWQAFIKLGNGPELFPKKATAEAFAREKNLVGWTVSSETQKGKGWFIEINKPIPADAPFLQKFLAETADQKTPDSWLNAAFKGLIGKVRSAEDVLSMTNRLNRTVAAYGPQQFDKLFKDSWKEIAQLRGRIPFFPSQKWKDLKLVLENARNRVDPATNLKGYLFDNIADLEQLYNNIIHRMPDEQEIAAAFSFKRQTELLDILRNLSWYKSRARLGAETHTIILKTGKETGRTIELKSYKLDGIDLKGVWPSDDAPVAIFGRQVGVEQIKRASIQGNLRKMLEDELKRGSSKIIKIVNPSDFPLKGVGNIKDEYITYAIVPSGSVKSGTLEWRKLPQRQVDTEYEHYIKQAIIRYDPFTKTHHYLGDATLAGFNIGKMGRDVAKKLDDIRVLLKDKNAISARKYYDANPIGVPFSEILGWFKGKTPKLSLTEPLTLTPRNSMIFQLNKDLEGRYKRFENNARKFDNGSYDSNDMFSLRDEGTVGNPIYRVTPVEHIDPITMVNRGLSKAVNSLYLEDYKFASIMEWLREAEPLLGLERNELYAAPEYHFWNAAFTKRENPNKVKNLEVARLQIKQFLGAQGTDTTFLHSFAQKMADIVYEKAGPKFALAPLWLVPMLKDPFSALRSLTFHETLGLFNLPQLWIQMNTYATTMAIAGFKYAALGPKSALLHTYARFNASPEMLAHLDKLASTQILPGMHAFKPGEWLEAYELLKKTGFDIVGNEQSLRNNPWKKDFAGSGFSSFLNAGAVFFREGERTARLAAWYIAHKEFRLAKPVGAITDMEARQILKRADTLSVNMSRASNNTFQQGIFSIPFQFFTYNLRLAELFLGKRLTAPQRIRLFGTTAVLYGVPAALGLSALPLGDIVRKSAIENGYVLGDDYLRTAIGEGLPSLVIGMMTGVHPNFGERMGPSGISTFKDMFRSDKTWWEVVGGVSTTKLIHVFQNLDGFSSWVGSAWRGDGQYKLKIEDAIDIIKEINSFNNSWGLAAALTTGALFSRKEQYIGDISPFEAWTKYFFGVQDQKFSDIYTKIWTREEEKDRHAYVLQKFIKEFRRSIDAIKNNNTSQGQDFMGRAFAWLKSTGYPEEDYAQAIELAAKGHESLISRLNVDFALSKVPEDQKQKRVEQLQKTLRLQGIQ